MKHHSESTIPVMIEVNGRRKQTGFIIGNAYYSPRKKSKHFFRKYNGYAISTAVLFALKESGVVDYIVIVDTENNLEHLVNLDDFVNNGIKVAGRGYRSDNQIVLPIDKFKTRRADTQWLN